MSVGAQVSLYQYIVFPASAQGQLSHAADLAVALGELCTLISIVYQLASHQHHTFLLTLFATISEWLTDAVSKLSFSSRI